MRFPCPCCGHLVFEELPGSFDVCPICFWEDDVVQLRWPDRAGANRLSLIEAQGNFVAFKASEERLLEHVREPRSGDSVEPGWRRVDPELDLVGSKVDDAVWTVAADGGVQVPAAVRPAIIDDEPWPEDLTSLYYWRPTFWRRGS
jgi:hypothetical protein